jgi:hypothetical protein
MSQPNIKIRKGQKWRKKSVRGPEPYFAVVIGKTQGDRVKTVCSDGNTHSILPFILLHKFELVTE